MRRGTSDRVPNGRCISNCFRSSNEKDNERRYGGDWNLRATKSVTDTDAWFLTLNMYSAVKFDKEKEEARTLRPNAEVRTCYSERALRYQGNFFFRRNSSIRLTL